MTFKYTPDDDVRVHEEGAIRLICAPFQSHENGLPEWLKNSSDAYSGTDADPSKRVIVVILETGKKGGHSSISCLDFVGMTSGKIESDFRIWADPDAASRGAGGGPVQGGHGNGGKCYMTQMFEGGSLLLTVKAQKACRYGVAPGSVKFGYVPDKGNGRDVPVKDTPAALAEAILSVGVKVDKLPPGALAVARDATSFTLLSGLTPKGYGTKMPVVQIVEALEEHTQMLKTLELCSVYVMVDGEPFEMGRRLRLPEIAPLEGAEKPRVISIPVSLPDPQTGLPVSTVISGSAPGELRLHTSATRMQWSKKHRHVIAYEAKGSFVGFVPVSTLDVASPYRDRIYGRCQIDAASTIKQSERGPLADSPLRRALEHFIAQQVQAYSKEFELRDRQRYNQEEKTALSKMNQALDKWKNRLLKDMLKELWGPGGGGQPPPPRLPSGRVKRVEVRLSHNKAGLGVAFRPTIHFFDAQDKPVRAVPFRWQSGNNNVAMVDDDLMVVTTFAYGNTEIWAETLDGRVSSNRVVLEVIRILKIRLEPPELQLHVGSRQKIEAVCDTPTGEMRDDIYLVWTESDPNVARVSAAGQVFAFAPGTTEITAGDDKVLATAPTKLSVVVAGAGSGGGSGPQGKQGFPLILVSTIDKDPETGETFNFSREDAPVSQRPLDVDRNIWWINSSAPFAALYLSAEKGYGYKSREWRIYHLERYIDVLVQIALTNAPDSKGNVPVDDWINKWGVRAAEIQSAAVSSLRSFIDDGILPEGPEE